MEFLINLAISLAVAVVKNTTDKLIETASQELHNATTEFFKSLKNLSEQTFKEIQNIRVVENNSINYIELLENIKKAASDNYHFQENINTLGNLTKEFLDEKETRTDLNPEQKQAIEHIELVLSEIAQDYKSKINIDQQSIQTQGYFILNGKIILLN
ncbi:MAG: hypothetical protein AB4368_33195 [Xenococcaceae cyanobacterium]